MKKLLTLSAALLAASLFFTACSNPSGGDNGGGKLPGTWTSNVQYANDYSSEGWTRNRNVIKYNLTNPSSLGLSQNQASNQWLIYSRDSVYGFKAKIKQNKHTDGEYGFYFLVNDKGTESVSDDSGYQLTFWQNSYILRKVLNGTTTCLSLNGGYANVINDAIKKEGQENEVIVYSEGNNLIIKVNGTEIWRGARELEAGTCNAFVRIPYSVQQNNIKFTTDFTIVEFQTSK